MRIAFLSWRELAHPQAGGSEVLIDRLARSTLERGHEVTLYCGGPVGRRPYRVVDLGGAYGQYVRAPWRHRRELRRCDVVIDVENGLPYFAPVWHDGPVVCLVHHVHTDQWAFRFPGPVAAAGRMLEAKVMPRVYRRVPFIAVSPSTEASLVALGVDRRRIHRVTNGLEAPALAPARSPEPLFLAVSRLVPHKRVDLLLRAWEKVRPRVGGRLVVVGDGPQRAALERLAGDRVDLVGRVDDEEKWRLMAGAWLLVHPAHHEGWGIVMLEAAAVGTPALGFDVPGVRDSIVDGVTGALVDSEAHLIERWVALTGDGAALGRMGEAARRHAAGFSWARTGEEFAGVLAEVGG